MIADRRIQDLLGIDLPIIQAPMTGPAWGPLSAPRTEIRNVRLSTGAIRQIRTLRAQASAMARQETGVLSDARRVTRARCAVSGRRREHVRRRESRTA
jgi:NAD(P)H-dependent flavin oxidoreductase YrpB (nitropropane dioxygenase family)